MSLDASVTLLLEQIAEQHGAKLWESPGIAPEGYIDWSRGQQLFSIYTIDGKLKEDKICYFTLGDLFCAFEIPYGEPLGITEMRATRVCKELQ